MEQCPVPPDHFSTLVNLIAKGDVTEKMARTILEEMFEKGVSPEAVIETQGLKPIQGTGAFPPFPHRPGHEKNSWQG
jgi:aspartyl-tRNA(Asn)/glutamyl-tRNA(Gln) amidotransferase subunit B